MRVGMKRGKHKDRLSHGPKNRWHDTLGAEREEIVITLIASRIWTGQIYPPAGKDFHGVHTHTRRPKKLASQNTHSPMNLRRFHA